MEQGFLLLVAISAGIGFLCRRKVNRTLRRVLLTAGFLSLILGFLVLGLAILGWSPGGIWTTGLTSACFLAVAGLLLPFAVAVRLGQK